MKPLNISQILPSIETALRVRRKMAKLRATEGQFTTALAGSREVSTVIDLLMERHHLVRDEAFEALRAHARSRRCALVAVACEVVDATEKLNLFNKLGENLRERK